MHSVKGFRHHHRWTVLYHRSHGICQDMKIRTYYTQPSVTNISRQVTVSLLILLLLVFGEAGDTGKRDFANFEDGLREMELCEAVIKSAKKDRWVKVGE